MRELRIRTAQVFEPLLRPARYKAVHGGRGSGKSRFFADLLIEEQIAEPIDAVCLREVQRSLEFSVKRELEASIEAMNAGAYFEVQVRVGLLTGQNPSHAFRGDRSNALDRGQIFAGGGCHTLHRTEAVEQPGGPIRADARQPLQDE